jgi:hypothetical protein
MFIFMEALSDSLIPFRGGRGWGKNKVEKQVNKRNPEKQDLKPAALPQDLAVCRCL